MLFREQLLWSAVDGAQAAESRADIAAHNCSRWKHAASFVSADELIPFRGTFPITAGMASESLRGYHRSFLGVALREGTKQKLGSRIPLTQNVGERKSNYGPCPFVYFQRRLLKMKTVDFFFFNYSYTHSGIFMTRYPNAGRPLG